MTATMKKGSNLIGYIERSKIKKIGATDLSSFQAIIVWEKDVWEKPYHRFRDITSLITSDIPIFLASQDDFKMVITNVIKKDCATKLKIMRN